MYRPFVDRLAAIAQAIAIKNGIVDKNAQDAFRHTYTSAITTFYFGERLARTLGDSVELRPSKRQLKDTHFVLASPACKSKWVIFSLHFF